MSDRNDGTGVRGYQLNKALRKTVAAQVENKLQPPSPEP